MASMLWKRHQELLFGLRVSFPGKINARGGKPHDLDVMSLIANGPGRDFYAEGELVIARRKLAVVGGVIQNQRTVLISSAFSTPADGQSHAATGQRLHARDSYASGNFAPCGPMVPPLRVLPGARVDVDYYRWCRHCGSPFSSLRRESRAPGYAPPAVPVGPQRQTSPRACSPAILRCRCASRSAIECCCDLPRTNAWHHRKC